MIKTLDILFCYISYNFDKKISDLLCVFSCLHTPKFDETPQKMAVKPPIKVTVKPSPSFIGKLFSDVFRSRERSNSWPLWDKPKRKDDLLRDIPLFPIKSVDRSKILTPFALPSTAKPAHLSPVSQSMDEPSVTPFQQRLFTPKKSPDKLSKVEVAKVFNNNDKNCPPTVEKPRVVNRKLWGS